MQIPVKKPNPSKSENQQLYLQHATLPFMCKRICANIKLSKIIRLGWL